MKQLEKSATFDEEAKDDSEFIPDDEDEFEED